ncbi:hypothetical protein Amn_04660 [Aminobacter sp. Y103A]|uniref:hypothetical protein n=1 Tax=Aminobacter sp. Y103A TaxID=1870862 RepID=UPI00257398C6|nr:hypothetical protein [Aminobacter sp. SS-2016]BBD35586.1 hypothetical protein Amn_04660 [Aminobacter sp. SS-2016]
MTILLRILRMAFCAVMGIVIFAALFEFVNALPVANGFPLHALWWGVVFRAPAYVFFGAAPLLFMLTIMELRGVQKQWPYFLVWIAGGLFLGRANLLAAAVSAPAAGYFYWLSAGKSAGDWISAWREQKSQPGFKPGTYLAYAVVAYLAAQAVSYGYYGGKLLWVSYVSEPGLGTPPVPLRKMSAARKVALMDFPDVASCLSRNADKASPNYLEQMDWDRINNVSEAEVCMFRLLASYKNISHATKWFEAQGFTVPKSFSSARPNISYDGTQHVHGSYSIRKNGPKFPTRGVFRRLFGSIPYGMNSASTWSKDGTQLLRVDISLNIL